MKKQKIIIKKEFDWVFINPFFYMFSVIVILCVLIPLLLTFWIPIFNIYFVKKIISAISGNPFENPLFVKNKYRITKQIVTKRYEKIK